VKKIESLSEYLGLMLPLNAQSLLRMHAPETAFEYAANLVIPHDEGSRTPLLHRQDVHLLDFPRR
jgi:hypothetical protein